MQKLTTALAASAILLTTLAGCAGPEVALTPAVNANDPACADVIVRLPDSISDQERRRTNAQSTGAWGSPTSVEMFCGIEPSGPTELPCANVNGIDWLMDNSEAPIYRFEAYGRQPGLEVYVDSEKVSGTEVVSALAQSAALLTQVRECTNLYDTID